MGSGSGSRLFGDSCSAGYCDYFYDDAATVCVSSEYDFFTFITCCLLCFVNDSVSFVSWNSAAEEERSSKTVGHMTGKFCSSY